MWRVYQKGCSFSKPYPIILMHGLLDCSTSWFLHADKYSIIDLDQNAYPTYSQQKATKFGSEITEETKYHKKSNTQMKIFGISI